MKVTPSATAVCSASMASLSLTSPQAEPICQAPKPTVPTLAPVRPRVRLSMVDDPSPRAITSDKAVGPDMRDVEKSSDRVPCGSRPGCERRQGAGGKELKRRTNTTRRQAGGEP